MIELITSEMTLGSFLSIASNIILAGLCMLVMVFNENEHFPIEYLFPFLIGVLGVILEVDWVITKESSDIRNLAWNFKDLGTAFYIGLFVIKKEFPKQFLNQ